MKATKKIISMLIGVSIMASVISGCSSSSKTSTTTTEKKNIKFYGKVIEYTSGPKMTDELIKVLSDKYTIDAIQVDWANMDTVIRTGIASSTPCDIYNYPTGGMANFKDMALDLKPYLDKDPEWKAQFSETALAASTVDGKIISLPWESNFTVILGNKEALEKLGITVPASWTMKEFNEAAKKIKDSGVFPFANATDLNRGSWLYRNAMLSTTLSAGKSADYQANKVAYNSAESQAALEAIKALYDNKYMYPGDGAVTAKNDEVKAAFYQGKVLMMPEIAAGAKQTAKGVTGFTPILIPWPSVGDKGAINGGMNALFIPKNSKNIDAAIEVLKTYTSANIQKIHAEEGYIPANVNVQVTDTFVKAVIDQAKTMYAEPVNSAAFNDYQSNNLTADLVLNGGVKAVMDKLEALRTAK